MVEQSMKRRSCLSPPMSCVEVDGGREGRGGCRIWWKTFLTWEGSGRAVMRTSLIVPEPLHVSFEWLP